MMKRVLVIVLALGLAISMALVAYGEEKEEGYGRDNDYGYHMMGPGWMMGPGYHMGPGYMMDDDYHGWGMHRGDRGSYSRPGGWRSMKPEQREKLEKMWSGYMMDTMELRKQIAAKRIEMRTLWAQPKVDRSRIEKLSNELAELYAEHEKKRSQYLVRCREEFGEQDWPCPASRW